MSEEKSLAKLAGTFYATLERKNRLVLNDEARKQFALRNPPDERSMFYIASHVVGTDVLYRCISFYDIAGFKARPSTGDGAQFSITSLDSQNRFTIPNRYLTRLGVRKQDEAEELRKLVDFLIVASDDQSHFILIPEDSYKTWRPKIFDAFAEDNPRPKYKNGGNHDTQRTVTT